MSLVQVGTFIALQTKFSHFYIAQFGVPVRSFVFDRIKHIMYYLLVNVFHHVLEEQMGSEVHFICNVCGTNCGYDNMCFKFMISVI